MRTRISPEKMAAGMERTKRLSANLREQSRNCPICGEWLWDAYEKQGSVYGEPCGHRMWFGCVPAWAKPKGDT